MRRAPGIYRIACHVAVIGWAVALLVLSVVRAPSMDEGAAAAMAPIRPLPEHARAVPPPETTAPTSEVRPAEAESAPPRAAALTPVSTGDVTRGSELLRDGDFPILSCSYESFASFREYARAMTELGARFVVVRRREILGSVDVATGAIRETALDTAFSPRARDYTGEPGLAPLARSARERFGPNAVVMMLVPRSLDAGLFGGIARRLAERGDRHDGYREIHGRYERGGGGVRLRVDTGVRPDGTRVELGLLFDLGDLTRLAPAGAAS